ncbi:hypothetical protein PIB30_033168 [Stylosanthes scabra]|uniref:Uncharacterized protein n=1 Tax=Stylosanthes scabra TaxID=79078 RepID=A0ABU6ZC56_9FABA|nr:hypothetical protein [Stylosanthes scabra]
MISVREKWYPRPDKPILISYAFKNLRVSKSHKAGIPAGTTPNGDPNAGHFPCRWDEGQNSPETNVGTRAKPRPDPEILE